MSEPKGTGRFSAAVAAAAALHVAIAFIALNAEVRPLPELPRDSVEIELFEPPLPEPLPEAPEEQEPEAEEPPPEPEEPPPEPERPVEKPPEPEVPKEVEEPEEPEEAETEPEEEEPEDSPEEIAPTEAPAPAPLLPETVTPKAPSPDDAPVVRLPESQQPGQGTLLGKVMGRGNDPFGTNLGGLEKALEFKADGPLSDKQRAEKMAKRMLEQEITADAVEAGLADDYFRELKLRLETNWRPAAKDLSDGGKSTERLGMMKDFTVNRAAWGEMLQLYMDMAEQYGEGRSVRVNRDRLAKARELFRSKKGNFRMQAIGEVILTQGADGKVLTIEFTMPTGHDAIDESIKDAIQTAVAVMPYEPPPRLSFGRAFRSKWRLRATWRMIPPTALLSGNSWDISQQGLEVDVPFEVKLNTNILLLSFDNRSRDVSSF